MSDRGTENIGSSAISEGFNYRTVGKGTLTPLHRYATTNSIRTHGSSSNSNNIGPTITHEGTHAQSFDQARLRPLNIVEPENTPCDITEARHVDRTIRNRRRIHGCARNCSENQHVQRLQLNRPTQCQHCDAKLFQKETSSMCCNNGRVQLEPITAPTEMLDLFDDQTSLGRHFRKHIRAYNHVFSFTSMGVHLDENLGQAKGIYTFRAQGAIYHRIGNFLPNHQERPRFLQLYIFDSDHEIHNRMNENSGVRRELIERINCILNSYNSFVHTFRNMSRRPDIHECRLQIKEQLPNRRQYDLPTASEVATILVGGENIGTISDMDIVVQAIGGALHYIKDIAGYYDPLQYPLLLPFGTYGWSPNCRTANNREITSCDFYSYMLQIRPNEHSVLLKVGRLLQQYVVDNWVKIETNRLRWVSKNQNKIRADSYKGLLDAIHAGDNHAGDVGHITILPSSMVGSPRDMYQIYQDAMALVLKYGKPDIFLTMTCNPSWPEIMEELLPGQVPNDRSDLVTRVFNAKFDELRTDLFTKHVLGKVKAYVYVVEFQKRGLPHAHILMMLEDSEKLMTPDDYNSVVRSEIPDINQEPELHRIVVKHMIHGPCDTTLPCMKIGNCKKGFPKSFSTNTKLGTDSYPVYRRTEGQHMLSNRGREYHIDNSWVVPYNSWLLLKYDCHINVEVCSSIQSVKYLYKYVYKGPDRVSLEVRQGPDYNEVKQYIDGRWISAHEAFWKIFKIPMSRITPSVERLQINLPNQQMLRFNANQTLHQIIQNEDLTLTMLTQFFKLNEDDPEANQFLYREIPTYYRWCERSKAWIRRRSAQRVIGRIYTVSPSEGDKFYLRMILNHIKSPKSFDDLLTVNGHQCSTFKQAAELHGLLEQDDIIRQCLLEASNSHIPITLRRLFASILVFCEPIGVKKIWDEIYPFLSEDYASSMGANDRRVQNKVLRDLDNILRQHNSSVFNYDIPHLTDQDDGSTLPKLIQDERSIPVLQEDLDSVATLNNDQRRAFTTIMNIVEARDNAIFFVDGPGGTGKTYLYRALLAMIRNTGDISIATATSGIAATLLPGGRTAHSRFKITLDIQPSSTCFIDKQSDTAKLIREAKLIIWDEAPMTNRYAFEALNRTLIDILGVDLPFGGKIMVFGGDFLQVLPVIPKGTTAETVNSSIVKSPLWERVQVLHLEQNMRSCNDREFAEFLLESEMVWNQPLMMT